MINCPSVIGEKKLLKLTVDSDKNIKNSNIYINPGLFLPNSYVNSIVGKGDSYWAVTLGSSISLGLNLACNYQSPSTPLPLPGKINAVFVQPITNFQFIVWIYFIHSYDVLDYTTPQFDVNKDRLLVEKRQGATEDATATSIYSSVNNDIRTYIFMEDTGAPGNFGSLEWNPQYGYGAGFYNKGKYGVAPYFTNPQFLLTRNGVTVNGFSFIQDTDVEFRCDSPIATPALVVKCIRTDTNDQTVQWETNYELDVAEITGVGVSTVKFKTPYTGPTLVAGTTYKWTFKIDKTTLVSGYKYRLIAIVYYNNPPTNNEVTSFLSDEFDTNADVPYFGSWTDISGKIGDNKLLYTGNDLTATIEERMISELSIDISANSFAADILNRLGIVVPNDIRRYLTEVNFTIKEEYYLSGYPGIFQEFYDIRVSKKVNPTTYESGKGITLDFYSTPNIIKLTAQWRNRYEANVTNISSVANGVPTSTPQSTQYWGAKNLLVEWKLQLDYDDYITPFTDIIVFTQKLFVKDYQPDTILKITAQNPPFDTKLFWCPGEDMCLQGEIADPIVIDPALGYYLITNIDPAPGSISTILEAEAWNPALLGQLTTPFIYAQEQFFEQTTPLKALFCIDETALTADSETSTGNEYKVSVIAKKI
jgi:hypothetical protein